MEKSTQFVKGKPLRKERKRPDINISVELIFCGIGKGAREGNQLSVLQYIHPVVL